MANCARLIANGVRGPNPATRVAPCIDQGSQGHFHALQKLPRSACDSAYDAMTDPEADDLDFLVELLSYVDPKTGKKRVAGGMNDYTHASKHHGGMHAFAQDSSLTCSLFRRTHGRRHLAKEVEDGVGVHLGRRVSGDHFRTFPTSRLGVESRNLARHDFLVAVLFVCTLGCQEPRMLSSRSLTFLVKNSMHINSIGITSGHLDF